MTTPTTSAASCDEQATPLPHSAGRSLGAIARANPLKLAGTFSLVALENILLVIYPLFAGFAIDAIVKGQWLQASSYALIVLLFWLIGALRRAVDTRTFTHIYAALAVPVVAGFGIKDAASASAMARDADGVVVGSALVAVLEGADDTADAVARAQAFLAALRQALDTAR